jgi:chromosome segregation ATPase
VSRQTELADKKRRQSQSMLTGDLEGRSVDGIERQQQERQEEKDSLLSKKDRAVAEESQLMKRMNQVKMTLMEREKALNEATQKGARQAELEAQVAALQQQCDEAEAARRVIGRERDEASREMSVAEQALKVARAELKQKEEVCGIRLSNITRDREDLQRSLDTLEILARKLEQAALPAVLRRLEQSQGEIAEKEELIRTHAPQINALNAEISSQERTKRVVRENLELREGERELQRLRTEAGAMEREMGGDGAGGRGGGGGGGGDIGRAVKDAQRELQRCGQERDRLRTESATMQGKLEVYEQQQAELRAKLAGQHYRGVEERHRRKSIEYETTMLAVGDLASYYDAL